ncbi:MAG: peptidoglycan D,D-transpeptidase FtsI family protein, partial [Candidatus Brocadiales bacterium]
VPGSEGCWGPGYDGNDGVRTYFFIIILFVAYLGLSLQLGRIQLLEHQKYDALAEAQHYKRVEIPARRGAILDRHGRMLAQTLQINSIYANPAEVEDKDRASKALAKALEMKPNDVLTLLDKKKRFVWLKRKVSPKEVQEVKDLSIKGVDVLPETTRSYPYGSLLSQVLGIVDIDGRGLEGIELAFDQELVGAPGYMVTAQDGLQRPIFTGGTVLSAPRDGNNVTLTVDVTIQHILEEELDRACEQWNPQSAMAIVMDPQTGEVLAMTSRPTFDPNHFQSSSPQHRRNRVITDCYEPGSLIKPLIVSGVLKRGLARPSDVFFCHNGNFNIGRRILHDAHPYGDLTLEEIVVHSSNIGMAQLAMLEGPGKLYSDLKLFGLGTPTGIEIPGETSGVLYPLSKWTSLSLASIAMGHEVMVTPLQLTTAFCALANGGSLIRPRIVLALSNSQGVETKQFEARHAHQVLDENTARQLTRILARAVEEGTGKKASMKEYAVAGKTGTAEKPRSDGSGYGGAGYVSSFIGYAPAEKPRLCVLVMIDEPHGAHYGGTVSAPVVREIIRRSLNYLETGAYCAMG